MRYIIMTWHIILVKMFVFSSIWRAILANNFVLRSEAAKWKILFFNQQETLFLPTPFVSSQWDVLF
jgi:hypothetical protein